MVGTNDSAKVWGYGRGNCGKAEMHVTLVAKRYRRVPASVAFGQTYRAPQKRLTWAMDWAGAGGHPDRGPRLLTCGPSWARTSSPCGRDMHVPELVCVQILPPEAQNFFPDPQSPFLI